MKHVTTAALVAALAAAVTAGAAAASSYPGQQYASKAHVTLAQARATVMRVVPHGTIAAQELEYEGGGSGLRYSFDVKTPQGTREVGIDAQTGKVLENGVESQASESGEGAESGDGADGG